MINDVKKDAQSRMGKSIEALKSELTKLRTGRAHTSLLDHITVDYYGTAPAEPSGFCHCVRCTHPYRSAMGEEHGGGG
jgi:hypothetical protein